MLASVSCSGSPAVLLFYYMPALISCPKSPAILLFRHLPTLVYCFRSPTVLSSSCMPAFVSYSEFSAVLLSCWVSTPTVSAALSLPYHVFVFCFGISALLLPLSMLNLPFSLEFSLFRTFKQSLSDEL